ncbi:hypothetical protein LCM08_04005 [Salipiger pacificus]|nr:hypothetical protein [Alloyangia pacifica]
MTDATMIRELRAEVRKLHTENEKLRAGILNSVSVAVKEAAALAFNDGIEAAAKAAGTFCWNRYAMNKKHPAVFTSHTHQRIEEALRALKKETTV